MHLIIFVLTFLLIIYFVQEPCLERKVQEDDLLSITEVPSGLDANEWHALHSEFGFISIHYQTRFHSFVQLI